MFVNGILVGTHTGGFDPFFFDITDALIENEEQEIVVSVTDPTDTGINLLVPNVEPICDSVHGRSGHLANSVA